MRYTRFGRLSIGTTVIALSAVLVGCASGPTEEQGKAAVDRTFVYALGEVPEHMDLTPWGGNGSKILYGVLDTTLVGYDNTCETIGAPDALRPNLAESWEFAEDGKSLIIHLGDAVSAWGNEITAADVEWSLKREIANQGSLKSAWGSIGSFDMNDLVKVVDDKTVRINVLERKSFDVRQLASSLVAIHDSTEAKKHVFGTVSAALLDPIAAMRHETLQPRLFIS